MRKIVDTASVKSGSGAKVLKENPDVRSRRREALEDTEVYRETKRLLLRYKDLED